MLNRIPIPIPDEVIDSIKARIKKERITDMSELNYDKIIADKAKVNKGIGDIKTPARPASIFCSADEIKKNGIAKI